MRRSGAIKVGKRSISFCAVLLAVLFPLAGEAKMGLGADFMFTGYAPFGGGAGITARFEKVPITATLSGAYLHGNNGMIKGSVDYWFLSEKLVDINDSSSFHFGSLRIRQRWEKCLYDSARRQYRFQNADRMLFFCRAEKV